MPNNTPTIFAPNSGLIPKKPGIYKVFTNARSPYPYLYARFTHVGACWYDANNRNITNTVISFFGRKA